jgi:spore coat protein CotF
MANITQAAAILTEQEILKDALICQKQMTSSYNTYAGECVSETLRNTMLNVLNEEHQIQAELFNELQSRGWYQPEQADQQKIVEAKQKLMGQ